MDVTQLQRDTANAFLGRPLPHCSSTSRRQRAVFRLPTPRLVHRGIERGHRLEVQAIAVTGQEVATSAPGTMTSTVGLVGLAVMGQARPNSAVLRLLYRPSAILNLALNVAEKGFPISVYNRTYSKTEAAVARAQKSGLGDKLHGYEDLKDFVASLEKPRRVIMLVMAGKPVDATIGSLLQYLEPGDCIIDGGNEWYENTERRAAEVAEKGIKYIGMGVSGGEEGARNGPSMMPGGDKEAYKSLEPIVSKVAAQVDDGPCVMYVGPGGAGNFVKMVHNGIEYGDMQLISEAYDVLRTVGGLGNDEIADVFVEWNKGVLDSFLIEITSLILPTKDKMGDGFLVDKILDKTGMKGTGRAEANCMLTKQAIVKVATLANGSLYKLLGKWTVQQAAELSVPSPTIEAALDGRFLSGLKEQRVKAAAFYEKYGVHAPAAPSGVDKAQLIEDVANALYASKICSYAQGMNIIKHKSAEKSWDIDLGALARIWKGGCIIRAKFLDDIKQAYQRDAALENLLMDPFFAENLAKRQESWRRVVSQAIAAGIATPGMSASLGYFDQYRREKLPANLVQAQRDFFGSHTYERNDGKEGWFHTVWSAGQSADSITTSAYNN